MNTSIFFNADKSPSLKILSLTVFVRLCASVIKQAGIIYSLVSRLSPLRRVGAWYILSCHLGAHHIQAKYFQISVFFSGMTLVFTFVSAVNDTYILANTELANFLSQCQQLSHAIMTLAYKPGNFFPFSPSGAMSDTLRILYTYIGLPCNLLLL